MPYYLAPYIGAGTTLDPFRPRGSDQPGWSGIDLRPDGSRLDGGGLNACLLHLPVANPDPQLILMALDPFDTLGPALQGVLRSRLGLAALGQSRWKQVVEELLMLPPVNGWKPLRPTFDGRMEIYLGGLFSRWRPGSVGASISENWNCANSASLTCQLTWTEFLGDAWQILTNQANHNTAGSANGEARADSDLATADHECQVTLAAYTALAAGFSIVGVICRKDSTATRTFYNMRAITDPSAVAAWELYKFVAAAATLLGTNAQDPVATDVMKVRSNGSSISGFVNGTELIGPITDTEITGNLRCGIASYEDVLSVMSLDTWSAADLGGAAATPERTKMGVGTKLYRPSLRDLIGAGVLGAVLRNPRLTRRRLLGMG